MTKLVRKFKTGKEAEEYITHQYLSSLSLQFEKISEMSSAHSNGYKKTPEGYVVYRDQKIAAIEVKLVDSRLEGHRGEFEEIKTSSAIRRQIKKAKKQLTAEVNAKLPKIVFLTTNEAFFDVSDFKTAVLGKYETRRRGGQTE